jgi:hypothetical protein
MLLPFKKTNKREKLPCELDYFTTQKQETKLISLIIIVATLISVLLPYQYLHYI